MRRSAGHRRLRLAEPEGRQGQPPDKSLCHRAHTVGSLQLIRTYRGQRRLILRLTIT